MNDKNYNHAVKCPDCNEGFLDLIDLIERGGHVFQTGLMLAAICPECGCRWPVNKNWQKRQEIIK